MQVELYFGQIDGMGFYSPRNEMEALNSMLSLINTSFSCQVHMQTHALHDLQDAIVNRIHEFGAKYKVENKIDKSYKCDKEKCLVEWAENNGVKTRLQIACKFKIRIAICSVFLSISSWRMFSFVLMFLFWFSFFFWTTSSLFGPHNSSLKFKRCFRTRKFEKKNEKMFLTEKEKEV